MSESRLTVVVGGGGVGKTTTAAALGVAEARAGRRVLVVTVDPARRLADALGVSIGIDARPVEIGGTELHARMPDSRESVDRFAEWLFTDPEALARVRENSMFRELGDALAGVHELVCVAFVDHELESGRWDHVVLDTAPSRHALEFLDYPGKLVRMLEARTLGFIAGLARFADSGDPERPDTGLFAWGKRRVGSLIGNLVGASALRDIAALFGEFMLVRDRWLHLVRRVEKRMASRSTRFVVVTGPSGAALDDAAYLVRELSERGLSSEAIVLNRATRQVPEWVEKLDGDPSLSVVLSSYARAFGARAAQTARALARLESVAAGRPVCVLPTLHATDPRSVVSALAGEIAATALAPGA